LDGEISLVAVGAPLTAVYAY